MRSSGVPTPPDHIVTTAARLSRLSHEQQQSLNQLFVFYEGDGSRVVSDSRPRDLNPYTHTHTLALPSPYPSRTPPLACEVAPLVTHHLLARPLHPNLTLHAAHGCRCQPCRTCWFSAASTPSGRWYSETSAQCRCCSIPVGGPSRKSASLEPPKAIVDLPATSNTHDAWVLCLPIVRDISTWDGSVGIRRSAAHAPAGA